jgi:hypothetical protein
MRGAGGGWNEQSIAEQVKVGVGRRHEEHDLVAGRRIARIGDVLEPPGGHDRALGACRVQAALDQGRALAEQAQEGHPGAVRGRRRLIGIEDERRPPRAIRLNRLDAASERVLVAKPARRDEQPLALVEQHAGGGDPGG